MIPINTTDNSGAAVTLKTVDGSVVEPQFATLAAAPTMAGNGFGTSTKFVAKAASGQLRALRASNANAAVRYLQVHNLAAAPAANAVPVYAFPIPAGTANNPGTLELTSFFLSGGATFPLGITVAISITPGTFTDTATAADHLVYVHFV